MVQDNEVITLVLALGVLVFLVWYRTALRRIPHFALLLLGYLSLVLSLVFTVLEGFFWPDLLNFLEHLSNLGTSAFLVAWVWCITRRRGGDRWAL